MRRLEPAAIGGVMSREVANFRTFWKATTFSSVLEPVVYLLAFGLGLGSTLVNRVDGLSYVEYVGTGMVATAVIFSSALPAMFGTFVKHRFQRTYDAILAQHLIYDEIKNIPDSEARLAAEEAKRQEIAARPGVAYVEYNCVAGITLAASGESIPLPASCGDCGADVWPAYAKLRARLMTAGKS